MNRTYGSIALSENGQCWRIESIEPHVSIRFKQMFPRVHKTQPLPYLLPNDSSHAADLDWFMLRYPLAISGHDREALTRGREDFERNQAEMERILLPDYEAPAYAGLRDGQEVRHYQAQAVEVLFRSNGLLLGDDVGLGKTYTAAAACLKPDALPAVVVCHPHLQKQWCAVIEEFTTLTSYAVKTTSPTKEPLPSRDVYVFRYTQIAGWVDIFESLNLKLAVYDEVQELRTGHASSKGCAAGRLSGCVDRVLALSATPIYNYGREIHNIMQFIQPDLLGSVQEFDREWCANTGRIKDPKALGAYLREQHAFLRRTKHDVGQQMPAVNRIVDTVDYDKEEVRSADELAQRLAIKATTGTFVERGQAVRELDILVRHRTGVAKAQQVADFVRILVEAGEPTVVAGWHRDVYDIWRERLADLNPAMYTGSETASQKNIQVNRFLNGDTGVLFMSLRSGAGLDGLQYRSSTIVFGELDWSPGVHGQCIGRLDREGQAEPVTAIYLVVDEGSDPPMMEVLGLKASEAANIVDPSLGLQPAHTDNSHLQRLVDRYLQIKGKKAA